MTEAPAPEETRVDYPEVYMRGNKIPEFPEGEFYVMVKARVAGWRKPKDGEKTCDLELLSISSPVEKPEMGDGYDEEEGESMFSADAATEAFRSTMKGMIGQSG